MSRKIKLSRNQCALVDDELYEALNKYKWHAVWCETTQSFYAQRHSSTVYGKRTMIKMHSVIAETPSGMETDHINGNTLDNRKSNLRICTHTENMRNRGKNKNNTSGYKGVAKSGKKWQARVWLGEKLKYLGTGNTPEEAAKLYDEFAKKHHGEFANINFPD